MKTRTIVVLSALIVSWPLLYLAFTTLHDPQGASLHFQTTTSENYEAPVRLAELEHQAIKESSGVAASRRNESLFWTHNDSGDGPFVYAFDRLGKHRGVWRVAGANALDWEDMTIGPGPKKDVSYLYLGDIGDNDKKRSEIIVYRVPEPAVSAQDASSTSKDPRTTDVAEVLRLKYADARHNAEALLVHPSTGDLYIVTKDRVAAAGVYKIKAAALNSGSGVLERVSEVGVPNQAIGMVTGGDVSPDGRRVILCGYLGSVEMVLDDAAAAFDDVWKRPAHPVNLGARKQGEAICYRADGMALLATSEGLPCPLIEVARRKAAQ
ncbi:MAG TPA: hypothetical protein VG778_00930 [Blastocatellia bacterium]|nr:hypothetical protein [Blastocatellia bacterium]